MRNVLIMGQHLTQRSRSLH